MPYNAMNAKTRMMHSRVRTYFHEWLAEGSPLRACIWVQCTQHAELFDGIAVNKMAEVNHNNHVGAVHMKWDCREGEVVVGCVPVSVFIVECRGSVILYVTAYERTSKDHWKRRRNITEPSKVHQDVAVIRIMALRWRDVGV